MRLKAEAVFEFGSDDDRRQQKIVREYREEYKLIGRVPPRLDWGSTPFRTRNK